jgi:deazaflavin-dependent oxidoreductase (nitroreductase family)
MFGQLVLVLGVGILVVAGLLVLLIVGMRAKSSLALSAVRRISRVFNPMQMRTAGTPGAFASVIEHRGRVTGRAYATPVGAVPAGNDFVISLPYGTGSHWLRNVLAAGAATLRTEGQTFEVDRPELIPLCDVEDCFSTADQRLHRLFRVDQVLRVRRAA